MISIVAAAIVFAPLWVVLTIFFYLREQSKG